jgi:LCP family protein required for cell wall assembly
MQYSPSSETLFHRIVRPFSRRGCFTKLFFVAFALVIIPVFVCGVTLVIYLLFPPPHVDMVVMGLDSRAQQGTVSRSDSIMLVGIDPARLRVSLMSIPRDLYIEVPSYGLQPINTINMLGEMEDAGSGTTLLSRSIENNFGVTVERYLRMDFDAFVALVDAVGGITVYVDRVIVDNAYPTDIAGEVTSVRFESGWQYMDGARALIYARTRHSDDDYRRAERQQQVLSAVASKLANPLHWPPVLGALAQHVDTNLTLWDAVTLSPPMLLNAGRYEQLVINRDYILGTAQGYAVPDYTTLAPWLEERFD